MYGRQIQQQQYPSPDYNTEANMARIVVILTCAKLR
jgi:hypothetical protein